MTAQTSLDGPKIIHLEFLVAQLEILMKLKPKAFVCNGSGDEIKRLPISRLERLTSSLLVTRSTN
jgi:hypothetical protein